MLLLNPESRKRIGVLSSVKDPNKHIPAKDTVLTDHPRLLHRPAPDDT